MIFYYFSLITPFLLAIASSPLMAKPIQTTDIVQFGHSDGYSKAGKFVGTNWYNANLKIEEKNYYLLFGVQVGRDISYFQIFSSSKGQTEQDIVAVKEFFVKNGISYDDVKMQAIAQIKKKLNI